MRQQLFHRFAGEPEREGEREFIERERENVRGRCSGLFSFRNLARSRGRNFAGFHCSIRSHFRFLFGDSVKFVLFFFFSLYSTRKASSSVWFCCEFTLWQLLCIRDWASEKVLKARFSPPMSNSMREIWFSLRQMRVEVPMQLRGGNLASGFRFLKATFFFFLIWISS